MDTTLNTKASGADTLLGIDWGTSNRRAYLMQRGGAVLARHHDDQGLLAVQGKFAESLAALRAAMKVDPQVPVVMAGMVGSASGWQEVPYLDASVPLTELARHLAPLAGHPGCAIVPGYCRRVDGVDVMRGEETQLLGAMALGIGEGWIVLPGTHSKWVQVQAGVITELATFMTGELFAMLGASGTLAGMMAQGEDDEQAFRDGLDEARRGKPLSNALFGVRARVVAGVAPARSARSFLSGLLIGTEFVNARQQQGAITVIASKALSARYASAAERFGLQARIADPDDIFCAALAHFFTKEPS
jgi:2-dehydro-3-deoxygalactonokinase